MKTSSKLKFLDDLTPKRMLSLAIIVVVVIVAIYVLWDKIASAIRDARVKNTLQSEASQYGAQTLTNSQINSLAVQIYQAMRGLGTDEDAVSQVLSRLKNNSDYAALRSAYASVNKSSTYPTLDSRIASEGTDSELRQWRAILDSNNINIYTF